MANNKIVRFETNDTAINALDELLTKAADFEELQLISLKAMPLLLLLRKVFENANVNNDTQLPSKKLPLKKEIEVLRNIIEHQKWRISGLMVKSMLSCQIQNLAGANMATVTADFIFNPNPVKIHCILGGKSEDLPLKIRNIYAIKSEKNSKKLFLKEPIESHNGKKHFFVETNSDFDELLWILQKDEKIIMRANRSFAVNVFEFTYSNRTGFKLMDVAKNNIYEKIRIIRTDSLFMTEEYRKQVLRIDEYKNYLQTLQDSLKKMGIITGYLKQMD